MPDIDLLTAQHNIVDLRQRVLSGEDISPEELAEALKTLRKARETELLAPKKKTSKKQQEASDAES